MFYPSPSLFAAERSQVYEQERLKTKYVVFSADVRLYGPLYLTFFIVALFFLTPNDFLYGIYYFPFFKKKSQIKTVEK